MIQLTPEQREYKQLTLNQLLANQKMLEERLEQETRPNVTRSIQRQLNDIEAHISRLQDELAGNVIFDEPVADELFKRITRALAKEKFYLARRYITKLETIEPYYPGLDRLRREAEARQVSRRTRSIAEGKATTYPDTAPLPAVRQANGTSLPAPSLPDTYFEETGEEDKPNRFAWLFHFHIVVSCLAVLVIACAMLGVAGTTLLQWLIEGG